MDNQSYLDACPNDGYGPIYEAGQDGTVWDICTTDGGTDMILFQPNDYNQDRGWVNEQYLE